MRGDNFDWILRKGATPSFGTGPAVDHTLGTSSGLYLSYYMSVTYAYCNWPCFSNCILCSYRKSPIYGWLFYHTVMPDWNVCLLCIQDFAYIISKYAAHRLVRAIDIAGAHQSFLSVWQ